MNVHTRVRLVILGLFLSISVGLNECKKLDGYKFPVYSTPFCPRNESEWNKRSSVLNCNRTNGYTCLPNENFTELLEFCYTQPWILIEEGSCLYLERKGSYVDSYSCRHFMQGCHNTSYLSNKIFENPACVSIGNGCFLGEKSCKSSSKRNHRLETEENEMDDWLLVVILIGILLFVVCFSFAVLYLYCKKRISKSNPNNLTNSEEGRSLIIEESEIDKDIFDQWKQEDSFFVFTKACEEVETNIKSRNLVIVTGHSGSGKSAIIQHIALKHKKQGWTVRRIQKIDDIREEYSSGQFQKDKTIFVLNDPFGNKSFDEILNNSWKTCEEELKLYIKTAKLMMSCRTHIIKDGRLARYLVNQSHIINIDDDKYKLSVNEKRQILTKYTSAMNLSEKDRNEIVKVDMHFPLLCKLYSSKEEYKNKGIEFFTEPVNILVCFEEFLALNNEVSPLFALVVFCHTQLSQYCTHTLQQQQIDLTSCFLISAMCCNGSIDLFNDLLKNNAEECLKKAWGGLYPIHIVSLFQNYELLHKLIEIGISVNQKTGSNYGGATPLILAAGNDIQEYGDNNRGESGKIKRDRTVQLLLDNKANINLCMENGASPLYIACQNGHDSTVNILLSNGADITLCTNDGESPLYIACQKGHDSTVQLLLSNGEDINSCMNDGPSPLYKACQDRHVCTVQHLLGNGANVNLCMNDGSSPLYIACKNGHDSIVQLLLSNGADITLCTNDGESPLYIACQEGHDSTVQLLLSNGEDINLCMNDGPSPLYKACQDGHVRTVQHLLSNGANVNLCNKNGASPLYIACEDGHYSIVQLLLSNGAEIDLCMNEGESPLFIACQEGHASLVKLLLSNGANITLCTNDGASPLNIACQNGHNSSIQLLLDNGGDID